jgi:hypothetical protein
MNWAGFGLTLAVIAGLTIAIIEIITTIRVNIMNNKETILASWYGLDPEDSKLSCPCIEKRHPIDEDRRGERPKQEILDKTVRDSGMYNVLFNAFKAGYDSRPMITGLSEEEREEEFKNWLRSAQI